MEEIWKDIDGFDGIFQVSSLGRVRSKGYYYTQRVGKDKTPFTLYANAKILSASYTVEGYLVVSLTKDKKTKQYKLHRLIAEAFIPNYENKTQINHINGVKDDNRIENLEWCTPKENTIHAHKTGLCKIPKKAKCVAKLDDNGNIIEVFRSALSASRVINRSGSNLAKICRQGYGKCGDFSWKYITEEEYMSFQKITT